MLVALSTYLKPLSEVDLHVKAHRAYLQQLTDQGVLLFCGRRSPPTGGVLIARVSAKQLQELLQEDPFVKLQLARYEIVEFTPTIFHPDLKSLLETVG